MASQEDNLVILMEFLDKGECKVLVIYVNQQGQLTPTNQFPSTSKNKVYICVCVNECVSITFWVYFLLYQQAVYFVKRHTEQVKKDNFHTLIMFGDMSHLALDHFTSLIDTVISWIWLAAIILNVSLLKCTVNPLITSLSFF